MKKYLIIVILSLFIGCGTDSSNPAKLPTNATNVSDKGNGWVTYELDGMKFLYHKAYAGYKGYESITRIN